MRHETLYAGAGIDLAIDPRDGEPVIATVEGAQLRLRRTFAGEVLSAAAPGAILPREMRIAVAPDGRVAAIAHVVTPSQPVVNLDAANPESPWRPVASSLYGERYVAIAYRGGRFVWATMPAEANVLRLEDERGAVEPRPIPTTSQGVLYWDVEPVLADDRKDVDAGPLHLFHAIEVEGRILGIATRPADRLVLVQDGQVYTVTQGNPERPRLAVSGDAVYIAYSQHGPRVVKLTPPYPVDAAEPVAAIGRPLWLGWFDFAERTPIGNCWLPIRRDGSPTLLRTPDGRVVAAYAQGEPDGDVASLERNAAALKAAHGVPVIGYWTRQAQAGRVPLVDWVGVESYRLADESLDVFERRVLAAVARCGPVVLIGQCYTSNAALTRDLTALVPVYARIAKACGNVVGLGVFSGSGRATGLQDHPEVRPLWEELARGIPSAPPLAPSVQKPGVEVTRFDGLLKAHGWVTEFHDRNNPDQKIRLFTENGSLRIRWENTAGSNTTGAVRKVM